MGIIVRERLHRVESVLEGGDYTIKKAQTGNEARLRSATDRPILGIAMSGFGMQDDRKHSRQAGFVEHLTKPVDFAVLNQAITRLAGKDITAF